MSWFHREKPQAFDREKLQPAVRRSYCNRELTLGFIDKETGKFKEYGGANSQQELEAFCKKFGIRPEDLKTIY